MNCLGGLPLRVNDIQLWGCSPHAGSVCIQGYGLYRLRVPVLEETSIPDRVHLLEGMAVAASRNRRCIEEIGS